MAKSLTGKVALVTGGSRGIGAASALALADEGANVAISYVASADKAEAVVNELKAKGVQARAFKADQASTVEVDQLVKDVAKHFGRLDILVNNAGMSIRKPPETYELHEWLKVIDTNLNGVFVLCQGCHAPMKRQGGGKIINIGSMMSIFGGAYAAPYSTSKGGIVQLSKSLATAWAKDNIQVNSVLPGWIDTELTQNARDQVAGLNERVLARTPAGRWGVPEDLSGIAVFLASAASDFVTGAAIPVDGGYSSEF